MELKQVFRGLIAVAVLGCISIAHAGPELLMTKQQYEQIQQKDLSYRFAGYPSKNKYRGTNAKLDTRVDFAKTFPTRLREALKTKPDVSQKFISFGWGCGSGGCNVVGLLDANTGKPYPLGEVVMGCSENENEFGDMFTRRDSDLLIAVGCMDGHLTNSQGLNRFGYHYFAINNGEYKHIRSIRVVD